MADKEKKQDKPKGGGEGKKKKKHLHQIITTKAKDGSFGHEHVYKDHPDDIHSHPPVFAGTSQNMEDLHSHMDDHFGGGGDGGGGGAEEEQAEAAPAGGAAPEAPQGAPGPEAA
jgi:hypothetical protein